MSVDLRVGPCGGCDFSEKKRSCSAAAYKVYKLLCIKGGCVSLCSLVPLTTSLEFALPSFPLFLIPAYFALYYSPNCCASDQCHHTLSALPFSCQLCCQFLDGDILHLFSFIIPHRLCLSTGMIKFTTKSNLEGKD